jgi:hypothetical protein
MSEMTARMDANEFAQRACLTYNEIIAQMQELAKDGFLKKAGGGFAMTDKGKNALKPFKAVPWNKRFNFYFDIGEPSGASAGSIKEFYDLTKKINTVSLEFHLFRGDFENWFGDAAEDPAFAGELAKLRAINLKNEELRTAITKAMAERYTL